MRNQTTNQIQKQTVTRSVRAVLCLMLALLAFGSSTLIANAADNDSPTITPFYINIHSVSAKIKISGIKSESTATLKTSKSMKLTIKMELQKMKSGAYETIETWTSSKTSTALTVTESRNINIFCDYRLKVTFTAGNEAEVLYRYPA